MNKMQLFTAGSLLLATSALSSVRSPNASSHRFRDGDPAFDLQKALADPKTKAILDEWAEREFAAGLKTKNKQLLDKLLKYKVGGTDEAPEYLDPTSANNALAAIRKIDPQGKGNIDELIQEAVTAALVTKDRELEGVVKDRDGLKTTVEKERARRHKLMVDHELSTALSESGVKPGKAKLHHMYLAQFLQIEADKDGNERIVVMGEDKKQRYGAGGLMSVKDYVKEYSGGEGVAEDWQADQTGGSGAQRITGRTGKTVTIDPKLSPQARMNLAREAQG